MNMFNQSFSSDHKFCFFSDDFIPCLLQLPKLKYKKSRFRSLAPTFAVIDYAFEIHPCPSKNVEQLDILSTKRIYFQIFRRKKLVPLSATGVE